MSFIGHARYYIKIKNINFLRHIVLHLERTATERFNLESVKI